MTARYLALPLAFTVLLLAAGCARKPMPPPIAAKTAPPAATGCDAETIKACEPPPVSLACYPSTTLPLYSGDPLSITAVVLNPDPRGTLIYTWSGPGVTGTGSNVDVDTGSLAPGDYTVKATIVENRPPKHGLAALCDHCGGGGVGAGDIATCSAGFKVIPFEPPTLSCSADPTQLKPGDTSTVIAIGISPQNRPLTYAYSATAGTITGNGNTAAYNSASAPTGDVGVTCSVSDDKGHTVTAQTGMTILEQLAAPPPATLTQEHEAHLGHQVEHNGEGGSAGALQTNPGTPNGAPVGNASACQSFAIFTYPSVFDPTSNQDAGTFKLFVGLLNSGNGATSQGFAHACQQIPDAPRKAKCSSTLGGQSFTCTSDPSNPTVAHQCDGSLCVWLTGKGVENPVCPGLTSSSGPPRFDINYRCQPAATDYASFSWQVTSQDATAADGTSQVTLQINGDGETNLHPLFHNLQIPITSKPIGFFGKIIALENDPKLQAIVRLGEIITGISGISVLWAGVVWLRNKLRDRS